MECRNCYVLEDYTIAVRIFMISSQSELMESNSFSEMYFPAFSI